MTPIATGSYLRCALRLTLVLLIAATGAGCAVVEPQVRAVIVNDRLVSEASASVELERAGVRTDVAPGTTLEVGDIVRTGANASAVLLLENGAVEVVMTENTEIRISSFFLDIGEVFLTVKRKLRDVFEVESEYGVAAVEGTVFSVRVHDERSSPVVYECTTLEGRVVVSSRTGAWPALRLASGRSASIRQGDGATRRTLSRSEFNDLVDRMNKVERAFRPNTAELVVPDLVGLTLADARRQADRRGITVGEPVPTVTGTVAVGQIAAQEPTAGGRLRPGASLRIDLEVEPATVPSLIGDTVATARRKLASADLQAGRITERPLLSGNFDRIIEQSEPANAKVVRNSRIDLVVAVEGASVPSLRGATEQQAEARLRRAGLVIGETTRRRGNDVPGSVVEQDPASGDVVEGGSRVDIVVEQGCTVPRVVGMSREQAFQEIRDAGFTPKTRNVGVYNSNNVTGQVTAAGTAERCGTTIQVDLGTNIG